MDEEESESSSPARTHSTHGLRNDIYERLVTSSNDEAVSNPDFRDQLYFHLSRLPKRYTVELNMDKVEDILLHQKILAEADDPTKRPVIHARFLKSLPAGPPLEKLICKVEDDHWQSGSEYNLSNGNEHGRERVPELRINGVKGVSFEPCSMLEDLNLDIQIHDKEIEEEKDPVDASSQRQQLKDTPIHEIIFSTIDKPKLLSQLSALLSDLGLDIREAHVYSTIDGFLLDVFEVQGWPEEETNGLLLALREAVSQYEGSLSGSSLTSATEKITKLQQKAGNWEIDRKSLKVGERIGRGSCGDLYRGTYIGQDVAIKFLKDVQLNEAIGIEFTQEVNILREVHHENVVHFIGACTKHPEFFIVIEYMTGGSLYDYLHKHNKVLKLPQLLKFAIDICKGMDYLHQNNIIHRDLKTANLLIDANKAIKVADFGVARFQTQEGIMTAETGTYRWMAPEVINHQPYNQKADVFSFGIVLWELVTSRIPYNDLTPVQAALGVRQGLRPRIPAKVHPRLSDLMRRCWNAVPAKRPGFSDILTELEELLQQFEASKETVDTDTTIA